MGRPTDREDGAEQQGAGPKALDDAKIGGVSGGALGTWRPGSGWVMDDSDDGSAVVDTGVDTEHPGVTSRPHTRG